MAAVSLTALCEALDNPCREALEQAAVACAARGHYEIRVDDYVESLLAVQDMQDVLRQFECDEEELRQLLHKGRPQEGRHQGRPVFSPLLYQLLQEAYLLTTLELGRKNISAGLLVLALLQNPVRYGLLPFYKEIQNISPESLRRLLEGLHGESRGDGEKPSGAAQALALYTIDFTEEARQGRVDPVFARGPEIRLMVDILTRRRKNNPILVGDPGVGKTAVVEGLALKIVHDDVPDALKGVRLVGLDMGRLQAGASVKGEFEKRLKAVIDEVKGAAVPTIMFIDEAHTLVGSGNATGSGDGANLLKPALARGEMRTIAATTWSEYKKYFEKDAALARRFQLVRLDEPSLEETVTILRGIVPHYEKTHGVYVRDDAVLRTAELAGRYITGRHLPDKAIDVLDTACARVKVSLGARPPALEALEEDLASLRRELGALERDCCRLAHEGVAELHGRCTELRCREEALSEQVAVLEGRWRKELDIVRAILGARDVAGEEKGGEEDAPPATANEAGGKTPDMRGEAGHESSPALLPDTLHGLEDALRQTRQGTPLVFYEVSPELVSGIVSEWTGIPVGKLDGGGSDGLMQLGAALRQRVRGQDHALDAIEKAIRAAHAGLDSPTRPTGVFLLVGPSGVGKTETALAVAEALFGGENLLISVNMSEFQEKHTISRLIGSPPGYVGYGEGGRLTEAVRRQPYAAVLFDEVEKAHPDVVQLFHQLFDKGVLADGEGREVDFRNTVIFLTSNLGGEIIAALFEGEEDESQPSESQSPESGSVESPGGAVMLQAIQPLLLQRFSPSLLGRMTVIPYKPVRGETLHELVGIKLGQIGERLQQRHGMALHWDAAVAASMVASCHAVDTGARNIDHIINAQVLPEVAKAVLSVVAGDAVYPQALRLHLDESRGAFACCVEE